MQAWEHFKPKLDTTKSIPLIFGTGGDMEQGENIWEYINNKNEQEK
jgi:hypothetical protein